MGHHVLTHHPYPSTSLLQAEELQRLGLVQPLLALFLRRRDGGHAVEANHLVQHAHRLHVVLAERAVRFII